MRVVEAPVFDVDRRALLAFPGRVDGHGRCVRGAAPLARHGRRIATRGAAAAIAHMPGAHQGAIIRPNGSAHQKDKNKNQGFSHNKKKTATAVIGYSFFIPPTRTCPQRFVDFNHLPSLSTCPYSLCLARSFPLVLRSFLGLIYSSDSFCIYSLIEPYC